MVWTVYGGVKRNFRKKTINLSVVAGLVASLLVPSLAPFVNQVYAATVVNPTNTSNWLFLNDDAPKPDTNHQGSYVSGPAPAPRGSGSAKLTAGPGPDQYDLLFGRSEHGLALADITVLSFQTYTEQGNAPSLQIQLSIDGNFVGRAVYEPTATIGSWSSIINPLSDTTPNWWLTWSGETVEDSPNPCPQNNKCTWENLKTHLPEAKTHFGWGFKADKDSGESVAYVDNVSFNGTTYDFEPDVSTTTHTPPTAAEQTPQTVLQTDFANSMDTWTYHDDKANPLNAADPGPNTNHEIVANPDAAPGDTGAVKLNSVDDERWNLASLQYSGTRLADIASLGFDVRTSNPGKAYINLDIDFNHHSINGWQGRLVYVPTGVGDSWTSHEAVASNGQWAWSNMIRGDASSWPDGNNSATRYWNEIVTAFPDAKITALDNLDFGSLYLRADGTSTTYYDNVYLATATENIRYNFELPDTKAPVADVTSHEDGDVVSGTTNFAGTVTDVDSTSGHYWFVLTNNSGEVKAGPQQVSYNSLPANPSFSFDTTSVPDGAYTVKLEARDAAGNKDPNITGPSNDNGESVDWATVTIDNSPPQWAPGSVHISPEENTGEVEGSSIVMQWSDATDPHGVKYYYNVSHVGDVNLSNGELSNPIWTFGPLSQSELDATGTAPGIYYWQVKACDDQGNCTGWTSPWKGSVTEAVAMTPLRVLGAQDENKNNNKPESKPQAPITPAETAGANLAYNSGFGTNDENTPEEDKDGDSKETESSKQVAGVNTDSSENRDEAAATNNNGGLSLYWLIPVLGGIGFSTYYFAYARREQ